MTKLRTQFDSFKGSTAVATPTCCCCCCCCCVVSTLIIPALTARSFIMPSETEDNDYKPNQDIINEETPDTIAVSNEPQSLNGINPRQNKPQINYYNPPLYEDPYSYPKKKLRDMFLFFMLTPLTIAIVLSILIGGSQAGAVVGLISVTLFILIVKFLLKTGYTAPHILKYYFINAGLLVVAITIEFFIVAGILGPAYLVAIIVALVFNIAIFYNGYKRA